MYRYHSMCDLTEYYIMLICLSVFLSVFLCSSVCLSFCLSVLLYVCLSVCPFVCLSVCLSVFLSVFLCVYLSACLHVFLYVCLSVCLSVCLPFCLSVWSDIDASSYAVDLDLVLLQYTPHRLQTSHLLLTTPQFPTCPIPFSPLLRPFSGRCRYCVRLTLIDGDPGRQPLASAGASLSDGDLSSSAQPGA